MQLFADVVCWEPHRAFLRDTASVHVRPYFGRRMAGVSTPRRDLLVLDGPGARELGEALIKAADSLAERRLPGV